MRIVKFTSENVKRIVAISVVPKGALITVGGKNGAGKSSVLDSIAFVLGGEKLVPANPIRNGETEAKIVLDLGDYIVTRRFKRDLSVVCSVCAHPEDHAEHKRVDAEAHLFNRKEVFGPTNSTLTVTNKEGAKYPSPQALLDKLYGKLTFDPLAFSRETPKKQEEILRRMLGLDFSTLDSRRKAAVERRTMHRRTLGIAEIKLDGMKRFPQAPASVVSLDSIRERVSSGQRLMQAAQEADALVQRIQTDGHAIMHSITTQQAEVDDLERKLATARERLTALKGQHEKNGAQALEANANAVKARALVPDFQVLDQELATLEATNDQVRANQAYADQQAEVTRIALEVEKEEGAIQEIDAAKDKALREAQYPVPGLGLTDEGVTFEGLPLEEVSSSVQLRVSVSIGIALNSTLKVMLVRNGNLLDEDGLKDMAAQAEAADAQIWMEYVTSSAEGVSVMLEDGHLA